MSSKHHYLPQFYLNGFVNENEKLHSCRKAFSTFKEFPTAGIYYQHNLNNVDLGSVGFIDLEKDFFLPKDNEYASAFNEIRNTYNYDIDSVPLQIKATIVEFVLGLYWRVPGGLEHVKELIDTDGLLTGDLQLCHNETKHIYVDDEIPSIISDIKSKEENQKIFMTFFYEENVRKHNWSKLDEKFAIYETNTPLLIGDIPFIPLESENKRGKILDEFIIPLDRNHLLIYASKKPSFLESNLFHLINLCIIDGASERISCNNKVHLQEEMELAERLIMNLRSMGLYQIKEQFLSPLIEFQSQFRNFEEFSQYHASHHFEEFNNLFIKAN